MKTPLAIPFLLASIAAVAAAPAQRMMVPDEAGRMLQLFDLKKAHADGDEIELTREAAAQAAEMLRSFLQTPLTDADDIRAVGKRWIAALGTAEQIAEVERMFDAARKHRDDLIEVEVRLLQVKPDMFAQHLRQHLTATDREDAVTFESVIEPKLAERFAAAVERTECEHMFAPKIASMPLQPTTVSVKQQRAYVKDYEVTAQGNGVIADPIVGTVWEGNQSELCATFLPNGNIGLRCDVQVQELMKPIAEAKVDIIKGGQPVTIQLPRTTGVRLRSVAEVAPGALVVLAAQRQEGDFLVAIVKATAVSVK